MEDLTADEIKAQEDQAWAEHEWRKNLRPADWQAEHERQSEAATAPVEVAA